MTPAGGPGRFRDRCEFLGDGRRWQRAGVGYAKSLGSAKKKPALGAVGREPYRDFGVAQKTWGRPAMPSAAYFRRQADICLRLSLISPDGARSNRLIIMAKEYATNADALEEAPAEAPPAGERTALPDLAGNQAGLRLGADPPD